MPNPTGKGLSQRGRGRPKGAKNKILFEIRAACQMHGEMAVRELARLAREAESDAAKVAAIKELLDRGYGKSPQPIDGDGNGAPVQIINRIELVAPDGKSSD